MLNGSDVFEHLEEVILGDYSFIGVFCDKVPDLWVMSSKRYKKMEYLITDGRVRDASFKKITAGGLVRERGGLSHVMESGLVEGGFVLC